MLNFGDRESLPTVLLIDDDMVSREVMATVLTMSGYAVHTSTDGGAAVQLLATGNCAPGVILMDAQMPGLSGIPLVEQLRANSNAGLYAMSGSNPAIEVIEACDGFLLKPFTPDALTRLLEDHVNKVKIPAQRAPQAAELVVNPETLAQLRGLMPEASVRQIYSAIVADLLKRIAAIEIAIASGDSVEIRRIGHAIKGGCSMAGAMQAASLGEQLEKGVHESEGNQLDNSSSVLIDLRTAAANLERMLEAEFPA
jgi:CheY-like chemotaxis protein/HPt (histidine-containing phosphotransfer) domain-containing protein